MDFGAKVKFMRMARDIHQEELEVLACVAKTYLSPIETGRMRPTERVEEAIRRALGWTPEADASLEQLERAPRTAAAVEAASVPEATP